MTILLTGPALITVSLLSGDDPRPVLVEVRGLTPGAPFTVTASAGGWSRVVQGASGALAWATQVVLVDVQTPTNTPVTWTVVQGSVVAVSDPLEVPLAADAAIQSETGRTVAWIDNLDNGDPRDGKPRQALYTPAGASAPILHYDVQESETGAVLAETDGAHTTRLRELLRAGAPVLLRTDLGVRDLDPVRRVAVTSYPSRLVGAVGTRRQWDLTVMPVGATDDAPVAVATLEDVNTAWDGLTLDDVNTEWAAMTLADLNVVDWRAP